jgi:NADPH:quinone reductase-like Zn-dependent oxidoreductase
MKAWQASAYGAEGNPADTISKLELKDVSVPEPKEGQVQIKVAVASVNPIDWKLFSGGLDGLAPVTFPYVPGFDCSGTISAVGEGVSAFSVGDKVCVDTGLCETCKDGTTCGPAGAFGEYTCAFADTVSKIGDMDFKTAAGLPLAGLTAYQALFTGAATTFTGEPLGSLKEGHKLLVLGGSTAVGAYAIQLAKNVGAYVATTGSDNKMGDGTSKMDYLKSLGADQVINYKTDQWAEVLAGQGYDLIFDTVGSEDDWAKAPAVLKKGSDFITVANFTTQPSVGDVVNFKVFLIQSKTSDLDKLVAMVNGGKLKVRIDTVHELKDVPKALTKSMEGKSAGKELIQVS